MPIPAERILKMDRVVNFGHIQGQFDLSDLTQIQTDSYDRFLQLDKRPGQRRNQGWKRFCAKCSRLRATTGSTAWSM